MHQGINKRISVVAVLLPLTMIGTLGALYQSCIESRQPSTSVGENISRSVRMYDLFSTSLEALARERAALSARGLAPQYWAETRWKFVLLPSKNGVRTSCGRELVELSIKLEITLPRAVAIDSLSEVESLQWRTFVHGLSRHEARHDSVATAVVRRVMGELKATADTVASRSLSDCVADIDRRLKDASRDLDLQSGHGQSEGAVLTIWRKQGSPPT